MRWAVSIVGNATAVVLAVAISASGSSSSALAGHKRHRHEAVKAEVTRKPVIPYERSYYPDEIEGGVSGNLPFNNQIRKSKDPLNANGGR